MQGLALHVNGYGELRAAGVSDAELRDALEEHGVTAHEFEAVRGWGLPGAPHEDYERRMLLVEQMVAAFGPPSHIQVVGPYEGTVAEGAKAFGEMCDRLADLGTRAALEYLPRMTNIPSCVEAMQIVETAGRDNGGLCVDSWHHHRSGETWEQLAAVPADRVFGVQFNDGPAEQIEPDYQLDCLSHRRLPGTGVFDLHTFVRTLDGMGVEVPYSIEVISLELDELPVDEAVRRMADTSRAVIAAART